MAYLEAVNGSQAEAWRDFFVEIYHQTLRSSGVSARLQDCRKHVEKYIDEDIASQLHDSNKMVKTAGAAALKEKSRQAERDALEWAFNN